MPLQRRLAVLANQSYLYATLSWRGKRHAKSERYDVRGKGYFNELSSKPLTTGEMAQRTHLSRERCQLILTQLVSGWTVRLSIRML